MSKLFKTRLFIQVVMATLVATLTTVGIVAATTTIGTSINTGGTLTVTSTTATSTISTGGLTVGTNQFVVQQTSGNVGIGTTTPGAKLHVFGNARVEDPGIVQFKIMADSSNRLDFSVEPTNNFVRIVATNNLALILRTNNGGDILTVKGSNVGIGTTTPGGVLHVVGSDVVFQRNNATATGNTLQFRHQRGTIDSPVVPTSGDTLGVVEGRGWSVANTYTSAANVKFSADGGWAENDTPGRITFSTTLDGTIGTSERMRINNAGLVGVGVTDPTALFHISTTTPGMDVFKVTAGSNNFVYNKNGNVGIGTSSPASLLHVSAGTNATTTVEFGAQAITSKTCFNVRDALGAATSFYFVGTAMVVEANRCR